MEFNFYGFKGVEGGVVKLYINIYLRTIIRHMFTKFGSPNSSTF